MPLVTAFRTTILYCIADDKYITGIILINCNRKDGQIRTAEFYYIQMVAE